jgi:hypothetical protein
VSTDHTYRAWTLQSVRPLVLTKRTPLELPQASLLLGVQYAAHFQCTSCKGWDIYKRTSEVSILYMDK